MRRPGSLAQEEIAHASREARSEQAYIFVSRGNEAQQGYQKMGKKEKKRQMRGEGGGEGGFGVSQPYIGKREHEALSWPRIILFSFFDAEGFRGGGGDGATATYSVCTPTLSVHFGQSLPGVPPSWCL